MGYRRDRSRVHRLFVACYPPPDASENLLAVASPQEFGHARRTPAEQIHLTLLFIGDTDERQFEPVKESLRRSVAGLPTFMLTPTRLAQLPARGEARTLVVEVADEPTLLEIHRRLVTRLSRPAQRARGSAFTPHLTIARYPPGPVVRLSPRPLSAPPILVRQVRLMASELRPSGAVHRLVECFELSDGPTQ